MDWARFKAVHMARYPSLFPDEEDLLDHTFFTIGNGLEWVNGQLTDGEEDTTTSLEQIRDAAYQKEVEFAASIHSTAHRPRGIAEAAAYERAWRIRMIKADVAGEHWALDKSGKKVIRRIYPLCQYSRITQIPDDVQLDWLQAAWFAVNLDPKYWTRTDGDAQILEVARTRIASLCMEKLRPE